MKYSKKFILTEIFSYIKIIGFGIIIAFLFSTCIVVNAQTPTSSMENTIMPGDRYFGFRLSYIVDEPQRQDIVIFKWPDDESTILVKRIIGIPGDVVEIKNYQVYVNGELLDEPYLKEPMTLDQKMIFVVPDNSYFMLGDNRNISKDARYWTNTYVKRNEILGKAIFKYYDGNVTFKMME